jgi:Na+/H+-dicarboxylate symporter
MKNILEKFDLKGLLTNPLTILASILFSVVCGVQFPDEMVNLEVIGTVYISLLKVVVLPFLLATILVGVISLLQRDGSATLVRKIVVGFIASMIISATIGVGSVILTSTELTPAKKAQLGALVNTKDSSTDINITLHEPMPSVPGISAVQTAEKFIPDNIFKSLDMSETLKIVIFCLIFGVALGNIKSTGQAVLVDMLQAIQQAAISIFKFLNYFLPIALFAMISAQVGKVGVSIFGTMFELIFQQAIGGFILIVVSTLVIWKRSRESLLDVFKATKESLIIAVSTRSSLACIPYAQEALHKLKFEKSGIELIVPLSFTVNRLGSIVYFAIATAFIANIYDVQLSVTALLLILFGSVLAGLASAGTTGILTIATIAVVCDLLKLPSEAVIILLIAIDPLMDMIRTASHVHSNIAVATFVCDKENG